MPVAWHAKQWRGSARRRHHRFRPGRLQHHSQTAACACCGEEGLVDSCPGRVGRDLTRGVTRSVFGGLLGRPRSFMHCPQLKKYMGPVHARFRGGCKQRRILSDRHRTSPSSSAGKTHNSFAHRTSGQSSSGGPLSVAGWAMTHRWCGGSWRGISGWVLPRSGRSSAMAVLGR